MSLFCMKQVSFSLSRDSLYKIVDFIVTFFLLATMVRSR